MSQNTQKDIKTLAYVLRRTNYGEADRILNLITPNGRMTAIAKAARKERSKLAGGIEMFSLIEINIHFGKAEMGLVTGAKMLKYYGNILADFDRMELAALILKKISLVAESLDSEECFGIVNATLPALDRGVQKDLVEAWFWLNYAKLTGEQINLYRDVYGDKLDAEKLYDWNIDEAAFMEKMEGNFDADAIKLMRLMTAADLEVIERVKDIGDKLRPILRVARGINKI
ncbi:DNA repair protein RecO [Candidatus Saccharibacteria bacterium]|nr:DNA repair protein RecO [Candidatus Saccharibacteria bacterium]